MSINYLDKVSGEWVQVWNDASGSQINIRGGMTEEGMLLVGHHSRCIQRFDAAVSWLVDAAAGRQGATVF